MFTILICIFILTSLPGFAWAQSPPKDSRFSLSVFQGWLIKGNITNTIAGFRGPEKDATAGLGFNWQFAVWKDRMTFEVEPMLLIHDGEDTFMEFGAGIFLRWIKFPWNRYLPTTLAVAEGISYTTTQPCYEGSSKGGAEQLLNLMVFELTVAPPKEERWAFLIRVHHRSRALGYYALNGESNFFTFGFKWRF